MLSDDSLALLLLCSHLGLPKDAELKPLTLREWKSIEDKIPASSITSPGALLGQSAVEIQKILDLPESEAVRLAWLMERRQRLQVELDYYASRGIGVMTRNDPGYPLRYIERLKQSAPLILFYAGEIALAGQPGIAVVGSRNLDETGQNCAAWIGNVCGLSGLVLYSGGARGVDSLSVGEALQARGSAVEVLAGSLDQEVRSREKSVRLSSGDLCMISPYSPEAPFSVGAAMGRNRLIYCLADYALVIACEVEKGGTWAGATEALKAGWGPVFVLDHPGMPDGNQALLQKGGVSFPFPFPESHTNLPGWLSDHGKPPYKPTEQLGFF